jgi:hypothetical protein
MASAAAWNDRQSLENKIYAIVYYFIPSSLSFKHLMISKEGGRTPPAMGLSVWVREIGLSKRSRSDTKCVIGVPIGGTV